MQRKFLRIWKALTWQILMCSWKERDSSKMTPKFLTEEENVMLQSPRVIELVIALHLETPVGVPIIMTSDLEWLIFKKLRDSQAEICS